MRLIYLIIEAIMLIGFITFIGYVIYLGITNFFKKSNIATKQINTRNKNKKHKGK
jgi:hypothetical protein